VDYQTMCNLAFIPLSISQSEYVPENRLEHILIRHSLLHNFLYKPNSTMHLYADYFHEMIAELDEPFIARDKNWVANFQKKIYSKNPDNIIGKILVSVALPKLGDLIVKVDESKALLTATKTNFALHAYKLEKGKIADSIADLSPRFLKTTPLDPFDGKPIKYSKAKGIVYSVGKNLTDVGGSEGDDWPKMDDPTIHVSYQGKK